MRAGRTAPAPLFSEMHASRHGSCGDMAPKPQDRRKYPACRPVTAPFNTLRAAALGCEYRAFRIAAIAAGRRALSCLRFFLDPS